MPADNELDPLDRWLNQQVRPLPPPPGTFELITKRARRRRIRKAVVSVASAAAVAAAVGVAVPLGISLHLTTPSTNAVAAGSEATSNGTAGSRTTLGTGTATPSKSAASSTTAPSSAATSGSAAPSSQRAAPQAAPAYLPPDYIPTSVTWDSLSAPAGSSGRPGRRVSAPTRTRPSARRSRAPTTAARPGRACPRRRHRHDGVTGLRFLNASYGWAFGPELWATDDGGEHWHQVNTGNLCVPQLETINGRAYALFANCTDID